MNQTTNYIAMFFVIAVGVTVGNLAASAIQTAFVMIAWQQSLDKFNDEMQKTFGHPQQPVDGTRHKIAAVRHEPERARRANREMSATAKFSKRIAASGARITA